MAFSARFSSLVKKILSSLRRSFSALQAAILSVGIVKGDVVVDEPNAAAPHTLHQTRQGGDQRDRPDADKANVLIVLRGNGEQDQLGENHQQQNGDIPVAVEKGLHYPGPPFTLVYRNLAQKPEIAEHASGPEHHRSQWIVGNRNRQSGFLADALIEVLQ